MLALHVTNPGSIPGTTFGSPSTEPGVNTEHPYGWPPNLNKTSTGMLGGGVASLSNSLDGISVVRRIG